jgi:hypothetical protein
MIVPFFEFRPCSPAVSASVLRPASATVDVVGASSILTKLIQQLHRAIEKPAVRCRSRTSSLDAYVRTLASEAP